LLSTPRSGDQDNPTCQRIVECEVLRLHKAHKLTPAMAAGITDKLWSIEDIVALVEASEPKPGKRGPYKKGEAA
jgi:hypothetical protein